ncbi:nucleotidyltransferase [Mycoplasma sp. 'Moose RK']|uniref:nucleotidyltransferase n=1 Tax=Mycoplasma sp. 'Moose RK' TaxID=2780095 RepID=UPI0018C216F1|nr:nucleotidyltransferase [Mycoplasma sp. 'Moose RK']MBG0731095.1 nucleotidyltransferase [Mycoplasma sp. 'Moose RK']
MSIAIIAEYNPFHNGHIFQLNYVKKHFPGEKIYIILSGNFTQRGDFSLADFETKAKLALKYGANFVIRLPFEFSTQAAHIFAAGAVKLVFEHKIDKLIFGSESNDIENMYFLANLWKNNLALYNSELKKALKSGLSFPTASAIALEKISGQKVVLPNDILGFEYVKQIVFHDYPIRAYSLQRTIGFNSLIPTKNYASASFLRQLVYQNKSIQKFSPMKFVQPVCRLEDFYPEFQKIVQETPAKELAKIWLISEGMENLFKKHINAPSLASFISATNSKRYTTSRIRRAILYTLLKVENPSTFDETKIKLVCWQAQKQA